MTERGKINNNILVWSISVFLKCLFAKLHNYFCTRPSEQSLLGEIYPWELTPPSSLVQTKRTALTAFSEFFFSIESWLHITIKYIKNEHFMCQRLCTLKES